MDLNEKQAQAMTDLSRLRVCVERVQELRKFQKEYGVVHVVANSLAKERQWCDLTWQYLTFVAKMDALKILYTDGGLGTEKMVELLDQLGYCADVIRSSTDVEVIVLD